MIGAIVGDVAGSRFEWHNCKGRDFAMKINLLLVVAVVVVAGCKYDRVGEFRKSPSGAASRNEWMALAGLPCVAAPDNAELLDEAGELALFAGETAEDAAFNNSEAEHRKRNSLFLGRRKADGTAEWRLVLTTGADWREAAGAGKWGSDRAKEMKNCFYICKARFASDGRHLWIVCDPQNYAYFLVCSYDVCNREFRALIDGDTADEQPDGTILVTGKKSYPNPDDGLGAIWRDVWINPEGKIVREGEITLRGSDL